MLNIGATDTILTSILPEIYFKVAILIIIVSFTIIAKLVIRSVDCKAGGSGEHHQ